MKTPDNKLPRKELVEWIYNNDYDYYANLIFDSGRMQGLITKNDFNEFVYDVIKDTVYFQSDYDEHVEWEEYNIEDMK